MQYGKYLKNHIILEWQQYYVNYELLKKSIRNKQERDFMKHIENELIKVNLFCNHFRNTYNMKINENVEKLNDFIVLNYMAIFKAIKKYDKKLCKTTKLEFFKIIQQQDFYKTFLNQPRVQNPTKLVIFDKDGTLIKQELIFVEWFKKFAKNMSDYIDNVDDFYNYMGFNQNTNYFESFSVVVKGTNDDTRNAVVSFLSFKHPNKSEETIKQYVKSKWPEIIINKDNLETCGNIEKVFSELKQQNIKIAICTSDDRYETLKTLKLLNLTCYVDHIICGDDPISSKPSPEPIWKICRDLNIKPSETIMVGDTISDVHAGLNAKCSQMYGVLTGGYKSNELNNADKILQNIDEVPKHLIKNNNIVLETLI